MEVIEGCLSKMAVELADPVRYFLRLDDQRLLLNELIGKKISIAHTGAIRCTACGRRTNKSFSQGYCYPCFTSLAQCDLCIVSPEKCHFQQGTCREPEWAESHCMTDHYVYLANSSGVKVGITRANQIPTRWIDQGAVQGLPIFRVQTRQQSGLLEDILRQHVADKTSWQAMLKGDPQTVDLKQIAADIIEKSQLEIAALQSRFGLQAIQPVEAQETDICYPVNQYPKKVTSFNLDKTPTVQGILMGIKGQYLILDCGVINLRKYTAYHIQFSY